MHYDIIIIGGGIVGFSTAMQLKDLDSQLKIAVLEKEALPAAHQTGHNSGVIHAGVYYEPGSLKARFCVQGCEETKQFCEKYKIPYQVPGKLIVATHEREIDRMENLAIRCKANGLTVERLTAAETQRRQPGLSSVGAFFVKETGIVNWREVCEKYAELFKKAGGDIFYHKEVMSIKETANSVALRTRDGSKYTTQYLITCSGLYADRLVRLSGLKTTFKIVPFRGEYFRLKDTYDHYFRQLIYPVPDPSLPFLGVHFTPQVGGYTTVGPNAVLALAREGYHWGKINLKDCYDTFSHLPVWKVIFRHFPATCKEVLGSISKRHYLKLIHQYFPGIKEEELTKYPAGVRAQAVGSEGNLLNDFLFVESERILHTCNAPSPAATSSLPIGRYIIEKIEKKLRG